MTNSLPTSLHGASDLTVDLWLVANQNDSAALARAANALFPPPAFEHNRWSDHRAINFLRSGANGELTAWWGPGASAKTFDAARLAMTYWLAAPDRTTVTCCSTTAKMLDQRIWGIIKKLYHSLKSNPSFSDLPLKLLEGDTRQVLFVGESAKGRNPNAMLRGVAIEQGSVDDAINNVIGVHNERMLLIVDEAQGSREALIEARINLRKGTKDFRILLIGNPTSRNDPLGRYSEPDDVKGYDSIPIHKRPFELMDGSTVMVPSPGKSEWDSRERQNGARGRVFVYNGFDSPSLDSPAEGERLHFLIHRANIERDISEYGPDHPRMWTFTIGFIPPFNASGTLFSETTFDVKCPHDAPAWQYEPVRALSIDPAFVRGGDAFLVTPVAAGLDTKAKLRIHFEMSMKIPLASPKPGQLMEELVCEKIVEIAGQLHVSPANIVFDATGNQRIYVGLLERAFKAAPGTILPFLGQARASQASLHRDGDVADGLVANARAEAYFLWWHFLERGHMSGVSDAARVQACAIQVNKNDLNKVQGVRSGGRILLEAKRDLMKRLNGKSPDDADTVANACYLLRHRLGLVPGLHDQPHEGPSSVQNFVDTPAYTPVPRLPTYGAVRRP